MATVFRFLTSPTRVALLLALACTGLVGASFFVQHVVGIEPCPLCIIQRFTYLGLIPVFAAAVLAGEGSALQRRLLWLAALGTLLGLAVAGYQTQLQMFPAPTAEGCSASLSYMLDTMSVTEVLGKLLQAKGDCADTSFKVLGLTLAQASLLVFLSYTLLLVRVLVVRSAVR